MDAQIIEVFQDLKGEISKLRKEVARIASTNQNKYELLFIDCKKKIAAGSQKNADGTSTPITWIAPDDFLYADIDCFFLWGGAEVIDNGGNEYDSVAQGKTTVNNNLMHLPDLPWLKTINAVSLKTFATPADKHLIPDIRQLYFPDIFNSVIDNGDNPRLIQKVWVLKILNFSDKEGGKS